MKSRILALLTLCFGLLIWAVPANAGGYASVHVDEIPNEIVAGSPVTFEFRVLQHDVTPISMKGVYFEAVNRETLDELKVEAETLEQEGQYAVDVTFPSAGSWKSIINPGGFQGTALPTLDVLPAGGSANLGTSAFPEPASHPAAIHNGTCDQLDTAEHELSDIGSEKDGAADSPAEWVGAETAKVVGISESTLPVSLTELLEGPRAIAIHKGDDPNDGNVACGDIGGAMIGDSLLIGLDEVENSDDVGVALLQEDGDQTKVTIYTFVSSGAPAPAAAGSPVEINLLALPSGEWVFEPANVTVPAGTTIKWTNATEIGHTIQSGDIQFEDSGLLESGQSFTATFDRPGTYFYVCGPHPWMSGTITVE